VNELNFNLDRGDIFAIDGIEYAFGCTNADGSVTMQQAVKPHDPDPQTRLPGKPNTGDIVRPTSSRRTANRRGYQEMPRSIHYVDQRRSARTSAGKRS
jgi:hypothetical protein